MRGAGPTGAGIMRRDASEPDRPVCLHLPARERASIGREPATGRRAGDGRGAWASRRGASEKMRRALPRTISVALATLAAIGVVAFGLQAAALGRQGSNAMLVVRVVGRLDDYHSSRAAISIAGRHLHSVCLQSWTHRRHDATVTIVGGPTLRELGNNLVSTGKLAVAEFELAGCPRPLERFLASQLNRGSPIVVKPTRRAGKPVELVQFVGAHPKLELFVTRQGGFPVALSFNGGVLRGTSDIRFGLAGT